MRGQKISCPRSLQQENFMGKAKKIVDAQQDSKGNIKSVLFEGNKTFTPKETAIKMAEQGKIDAVAVHPKGKEPHLRTKPDGKEKNNLDYLADN
jgi:hypothetical protein